MSGSLITRAKHGCSTVNDSLLPPARVGHCRGKVVGGSCCSSSSWAYRHSQGRCTERTQVEKAAFKAAPLPHPAQAGVHWNATLRNNCKRLLSRPALLGVLPFTARASLATVTVHLSHPL
eukprot:365384-Chlamydomonas_euryale.AAC.2